MRNLEILKHTIKTVNEAVAVLEYKRDVTGKQFGDKMLKHAIDDPYLFEEVMTAHYLGYDNYVFFDGADIDQYYELNDIDPEATAYKNRDIYLNTLFEKFEDVDPTKDHQYVPWIARMYAGYGPQSNFEDIVSKLRPYLEDYDNRKKHNQLAPEHRDIMRFKTIDDLMDMIDGIVPTSPEASGKGAHTELYEDDVIRVVVPHNEEAAVYYGQGTRWCTAARNDNNMFDYYNRDGRLYIVLPKAPSYTGEKYQLHLETGSYMNEKDTSVSLISLLNKYPQLRKALSKTSFNRLLIMLTPDQIRSALRQIIEVFVKSTNYIHTLGHLDNKIQSDIARFIDVLDAWTPEHFYKQVIDEAVETMQDPEDSVVLNFKFIIERALAEADIEEDIYAMRTASTYVTALLMFIQVSTDDNGDIYVYASDNHLLRLLDRWKGIPE